MNYKQKEIIHEYFKLDKLIQSKKRRLEYIKLEFDNINYCGSTVFSFNDGIQYRGFRVDTRVVGYVDLITTINRQIKAMERKQGYFNHFLTTLSNDTIISLNRRYKHYIGAIDNIQTMPSDYKVWEEIEQIEEAISFEFGTEKDLQAIRIENTELTNDTLESSFDEITAFLGV